MGRINKTATMNLFKKKGMNPLMITVAFGEDGMNPSSQLCMTIYKLITNELVNKLHSECRGIQKIPDPMKRPEIFYNLITMFFAEDIGILVSDSVKNARHNLKTLVRAGRPYGLTVNRDKSYVSILNNSQGLTVLDGIKVKNNAFPEDFSKWTPP